MMKAVVTNSFRPGHTEIAYKGMKFLITDKPTEATLNEYIVELKRRNVTDVVRVCESDYSVRLFQDEAISVHDWYFADGTLPPPPIVTEWFQLLSTRFRENPNACIAVHCVAGLGRAPVLVAIALIELGMRYEDAVEQIREKRRGAINAKQLQYLSEYRSSRRLKRTNDRRCTLT